jgi:hypothetical protein
MQLAILLLQLAGFNPFVVKTFMQAFDGLFVHSTAADGVSKGKKIVSTAARQQGTYIRILS